MSVEIVRVGSPDESLLKLVSRSLSASVSSSLADLSFARHPERNQYHSTAILERIVRDGRTVLGITEVDLYIPILTFVFGEAEMNGRGAIISYHRLADEFYGLPANRALLEERLIKEAVHELGHVWGLVHCHEDYRCVMAASHAVEKIDVKGREFCDHCRALVPRMAAGVR